MTMDGINKTNLSSVREKNANGEENEHNKEMEQEDDFGRNLCNPDAADRRCMDCFGQWIFRDGKDDSGK